MLPRVALVRTDVLEERIASVIRVKRISELGTIALTTIPLKRRFLQEPQGVTTQRAAFFID
jgi:hypothetical protein